MAEIWGDPMSIVQGASADELIGAGYGSHPAPPRPDPKRWSQEDAAPLRARKVGGSYQAAGTVVAQFKTLTGKDRVVFEFDEPAGMLHIFDVAQIERDEGAAHQPSAGRTRADESSARWVGKGWVSIGVAHPPCDGRTVFIGENDAGFLGCFNHIDCHGVCWMVTPEDSVSIMSELRAWRIADRPPAPASASFEEKEK